MEDRSKILILGAGCAIGQRLQAALGPQRTLATYRRRSVPEGLYFELPGMELSEIIDRPSRFSHAVILLAETDPDTCFRNRADAEAINVDGIRRIIDWSLDHGIVPVFTSSRSVFDGEKGDYVESDPARPITEYGRQKLRVERYLEDAGAPFTILRLSSVVGIEPGDGTLFTNWLPALDRGDTIRCAQDQRFSPVFIDDVIAALVATVEQDLRGTFHVAGPAGMTRLEMLQLLIGEMRRHGPCDVTVDACDLDEFPTLERRPLDTTMRADKLTAATGLRFRHPTDICAEICASEAARRRVGRDGLVAETRA